MSVILLNSTNQMMIKMILMTLMRAFLYQTKFRSKFLGQLSKY